MLWKGPLVKRVDERTGIEDVDFLEDRFAVEAVNVKKINNFFTVICFRMRICASYLNEMKSTAWIIV